VWSILITRFLNTLRKPTPVQPGPPQIPHDLTPPGIDIPPTVYVNTKNSLHRQLRTLVIFDPCSLQNRNCKNNFNNSYLFINHKNAKYFLINFFALKPHCNSLTPIHFNNVTTKTVIPLTKKIVDHCSNYTLTTATSEPHLKQVTWTVFLLCSRPHILTRTFEIHSHSNMFSPRSHKNVTQFLKT
jgi:hypothetical protein